MMRVLVTEDARATGSKHGLKPWDEMGGEIYNVKKDTRGQLKHVFEVDKS